MRFQKKLALLILAMGVAIPFIPSDMLGPVTTAPAAAASKKSRTQQLAARRRMSLPSRGAITSRFGRRWGAYHHGVDIRAKVGTPVRAALAGTVTSTSWHRIYGRQVVVNHGNGLATRYAHNSRLLVRRGQRIAKGQVLALSGATGRVTGPHIHFEVLRNGRAVNPLSVVAR